MVMVLRVRGQGTAGIAEAAAKPAAGQPDPMGLALPR